MLMLRLAPSVSPPQQWEPLPETLVWDFGFKGLGFKGLGFKGLRSEGLGFEGLGWPYGR